MRIICKLESRYPEIRFFLLEFVRALTDGVRVDDLVLGVDVDLAALVLPRLDGQQEQVQLSVTNLGHLKLNQSSFSRHHPLSVKLVVVYRVTMVVLL